MYVYMYVCMYVYMYVCMYVYMYVSMYMYAYLMQDFNLGSANVLKTRKDRRCDSHGGVTIYTKDYVPFEEIKYLKHKDIEAVWIEVT